MKRHGARRATQGWSELRVPHAGPPKPLLVRKQTLPARHYFPEHSHGWHQLVYAVSGALTVNTEGRSFVISPDHAVWLPANTLHRVGSLLGAEFRSLYVARTPRLKLPGSIRVFRVSHLLRALVIEASDLKQASPDPYTARVTKLILDQLERAEHIDFSLPWPTHPSLVTLCDALYADPSDARDVNQWGSELGMSARTLTRHFEHDVGLTIRNWRRRLRLFKAIELLGGGRGITDTAFDLGYASASAFIYMFRQETGQSPRSYQRQIPAA